MSTLFLSHSSHDNAAAVALRDWMQDEGFADVFLDIDPKRGIAAGERWERALHEAAGRCEAVLFLVSRAWLGSGWCLKEFNLAHKLNKRLFGVLIEDIPAKDLPVNLVSTWQLVNLASGRDHVLLSATLPFTHDEAHVTFSAEGLTRLRTGLRRAGLDPTVFAWPPASDPKRFPYPGLRPLEAEDAGIFFGREAQTIEALDRIRALRGGAAPRLLCILGSSGSGKSSFLRAGLWPRLARDERNFLPLPVLRPERAALTGKSGLLTVLEAAADAQGLGLARASLRAAISGGAASLREVLAKLRDARTQPPDEDETGGPAVPPLLVLPIDQGEELFLGEGAHEGGALLALLRDLVLEDVPALAVVLAIRSDAFERLQLAPALEGIALQTMTFGPMPRGVYGTIIEGPAARMRDADRPLEVEPALTRALLDDLEIGGARDALPLLAFTLERLWREYGGSGRLTLADYEQLGRVRGSIEAGVEEVLRKADADPRLPQDRAAQLALLRRALIPWLAGIDPETGSPRRRVARRTEIPAEAAAFVELLTEARLLSADTDAAGKATVEPAHEALLRQWGLLQGWLEEDFAALTALEGVGRAAREWEANARGEAWLAHGGERLAEAERLLERPDLAAQIGPSERDYLAACKVRVEQETAKEQQRARQRRWIQWGASTAALVFAVLSLVALWQSQEAKISRQEALMEKGTAEKSRDFAQKTLDLVVDKLLPPISYSNAFTSTEAASRLNVFVEGLGSNIEENFATDDARRSIYAINYNLSEMYLRSGSVYIAVNLLDKASEALNSIKVHTKSDINRDYNIHRARGGGYYDVSDYENAREDLEKALSLLDDIVSKDVFRERYDLTYLDINTKLLGIYAAERNLEKVVATANWIGALLDKMKDGEIVGSYELFDIYERLSKDISDKSYKVVDDLIEKSVNNIVTKTKSLRLLTNSAFQDGLMFFCRAAIYEAQNGRSDIHQMMSKLAENYMTRLKYTGDQWFQHAYKGVDCMNRMADLSRRLGYSTALVYYGPEEEKIKNILSDKLFVSANVSGATGLISTSFMHEYAENKQVATKKLLERAKSILFMLHDRAELRDYNGGYNNRNVDFRDKEIVSIANMLLIGVVSTMINSDKDIQIDGFDALYQLKSMDSYLRGVHTREIEPYIMIKIYLNLLANPIYKMSEPINCEGNNSCKVEYYPITTDNYAEFYKIVHEEINNQIILSDFSRIHEFIISKYSLDDSNYMRFVKDILYSPRFYHLVKGGDNSISFRQH